MHTIRDANGTRDFAPFVALEIASYPNTKSCYLFHNPKTARSLILGTTHSKRHSTKRNMSSEFNEKNGLT